MKPLTYLCLQRKECVSSPKWKVMTLKSTLICAVFVAFYTQKIAQEKNGLNVHVAAGYMKSVAKIVF